MSFHVLYVCVCVLYYTFLLLPFSNKLSDLNGFSNALNVLLLCGDSKANVPILYLLTFYIICKLEHFNRETTVCIFMCEVGVQDTYQTSVYFWKRLPQNERTRTYSLFDYYAKHRVLWPDSYLSHYVMKRHKFTAVTNL